MQHFLLVRVDTLEVLHLWHLDELHERSQKLFVGLSGEGLFDYIDTLQKFCTHASSGKLVTYNSSSSWFMGVKFLFLAAHIPTL